MKRIVLLILAAVMVISLVACGTDPVSTQGTAQGTGNTPATAKEGSVEDIDYTKVKSIVTDIIELPENSMYRRDYASTAYYAVYNFNGAEEIREYDVVYFTDPAKYEDSNRIMIDTGCNPAWSEDKQTATITRRYGIGMNAQDIIDSLSKNGESFQAIMKDGSVIHVAF